jgi:hypothetical protein
MKGAFENAAPSVFILPQKWHVRSRSTARYLLTCRQSRCAQQTPGGYNMPTPPNGLAPSPPYAARAQSNGQAPGLAPASQVRTGSDQPHAARVA